MPKCPICDAMNPTGSVICKECGAPIAAPGDATEDLEGEVRSLLEQGHKLEAVKLYRQETGCGLKVSKEAVEAFQQGRGPLQVVGIKKGEAADLDSELQSQLLDLLRQGKSLQATKQYRDRTGASLMESKRAVEAVAQRHGLESSGGGCSGAILALAVAVASVAMLVLAGLRQAAW